MDAVWHPWRYRNMPRLIVALAFIVLGTLAPTKAHAQYTTGPNPLIDALYFQAIAKRNVGKIAAAYDAKQGKPAAAKPGSTRAPLSATDFKRDGRRPTVTAFLGTTSIDPQIKDALQEAADGVFVAVAKEFRKDNLATAMGFAMAAAIEVSSGNEISREQAREIIANVNDIMVTTPEVKKMTPAQMQDLHDRLVMSTTFMLVFSQMQDPKLKEMGQSLARYLIAQLKGTPASR
jgi:hypothetical protein